MSKKVLLITAGITFVLFLLNTNSIYYKQALACPSGTLARKFLRNLFMGAKGSEVPLDLNNKV